MDDDNDLSMPVLPGAIVDWIDKKTKAYHARKTSGKTAAQYRAGLEYTASERLQICTTDGCDDADAEYIVIRSLGKGLAVFHALLSEHNNSRFALIETERKAERQVAQAKLQAQAHALETMKEDRDITRNLVERVASMVTQVNGTMALLADKLPTLALTHEAKAANPEASNPEASNGANGSNPEVPIPPNPEASNPDDILASNPEVPIPPNPEPENPNPEGFEG